jgi:hypothetical protein
LYCKGTDVCSWVTGVGKFCNVIPDEFADSNTEIGSAGSTAERRDASRGTALVGVLLLKLGIVVRLNP